MLFDPPCPFLRSAARTLNPKPPEPADPNPTHTAPPCSQLHAIQRSSTLPFRGLTCSPVHAPLIAQQKGLPHGAAWVALCVLDASCASAGWVQTGAARYDCARVQTSPWMPQPQTHTHTHIHSHSKSHTRVHTHTDVAYTRTCRAHARSAPTTHWTNVSLTHTHTHTKQDPAQGAHRLPHNFVAHVQIGQIEQRTSGTGGPKLDAAAISTETLKPHLVDEQE